jgi:hypothetical protein
MNSAYTFAFTQDDINDINSPELYILIYKKRILEYLITILK